MAGDVHAGGVGEEEGEVEFAEAVRPAAAIEGRPSGGVGGG